MSRFLRILFIGLALLAFPGRATLALAGEGEGHGDGGGGGGAGSGGAGGSSGGSGGTGGAGGTGGGGRAVSGGEDGGDGAGATGSSGAAASAPAGSLGSIFGGIFRGGDDGAKDVQVKDTGAKAARKEKSGAMALEQAAAREAVKRGEIQPFEAVKRNVESAVGGSVLKVRLSHASPTSWTYSLVVLTPEGRYRKVQVDAAANRIEEVK